MNSTYSPGACRRSFPSIAAAILCMLMLFACKEKRPAVIETPVFEAWSTSTLEIEKIEMTDSATIFHIQAFFQPKQWIRISSDAYIKPSGTDEKFTVVNAEGIGLDEEFSMPESGEAAFKLYFPPLKPEITKIDFVECDFDGCFNIWGIHLMPGAKVDVAPIMAQKQCTKPLPASEYSTKPARLSGKYFGYSKAMNKEVRVDYLDFAGETQSVTAKVAGDGSFSLEAPVGFPGIYHSSLGRIFLTPGQEVKWYVDLVKQTREGSRLRKDKEPGDSVNIFTEGDEFFISKADIRKVAQTSSYNENREAFLAEVFGKTPDEFKDIISKKYEKRLDALKQSNDSEAQKILTEAFLKSSALQDFIRYPNYMFNGYAQAHHITGDDRDTITYKPERPNDTYYASVIKDFFTDRIAYTPDFRMITSLLYSVYVPADKRDKPVKEQFAVFKENAKSALGETSGTYDRMLALMYSHQTEKSFYTDAGKEEIKAAFAGNPAYAETLITENDKMKALTEESKSLVKPVPDVAENKVFDEILKQYKGKVILVDFWATWCGPCKQALKEMKPLKESWKDKNIVFVYLTGETSPLATWYKMIPDIHGEHYRVSNSQWSYWYKSMNIEGVPTYMIYNKDGKQVQRYVGYPGNEDMRKVIEALLQ